MKKLISLTVVIIIICLSVSKTSKVYTAPDKDAVTSSANSPASVTSSKEKPNYACNSVAYNIMGNSYKGKIIENVIITPEKYDKTVLLTFAVHGFEGSWDNDGASLVQIANDVIREFSDHIEELHSTRLIVVPCVNPDGVWEGQSSAGYGRCNAQGIDINRDFDYHWTYCGDSNYHTGRSAFSTPEARLLRDLVLREKPDIIIDFHGWLSGTYGNKELSDFFDKEFGIKNLNPIDPDQEYMQQFFTGWASQYARTLLVEYPDPGNPADLNTDRYSSRTISVIKQICR